MAKHRDKQERIATDKGHRPRHSAAATAGSDVPARGSAPVPAPAARPLRIIGWLRGDR